MNKKKTTNNLLLWMLGLEYPNFMTTFIQIKMYSSIITHC